MNTQSAGVSGILIIDNKVMVIRRAPHETEQTWEFPKGGVEFGENPADAIIREFAEEVGLKVTISKILDLLSWQYSRDSTNYHVIEVVYLVKLANKESLDSLKLSSDHDDIKWVSVKELENLEPFISARRELLRKVLLNFIQ